MTDIREAFCRHNDLTKKPSSCGTMLSCFVKVGIKKTEEMFNFTLLKKSFTEQKTERKRETKVVVQPKGFFKKLQIFFFSI